MIALQRCRSNTRSACRHTGAAERATHWVGCKTHPATHIQRHSNKSSSKHVCKAGLRTANVLPLACCKTGAGGWSPGTNCINPGWEAQKPVQQPGKGAKGAGVRQGQGLAGDEHHSASHSMERQKKKHLAIYKLFYHISRGSLQDLTLQLGNKSLHVQVKSRKYF